jgi:hypothetical protein
MASTNRPDRAVQRFVGAAHRFNPVDGVQHRSVMPAAKLPADLLERRTHELPHSIARGLDSHDVIRKGKAPMPVGAS